MLEIAICDDNEKDQEMIQKFIADYMNGKKLCHSIYTYKTGEELLESNYAFHVVFLDIAVGGGMNGIITGKKFRFINKKTKIIYITSYQQYMEQALNGVHAFAYLKKPIERDIFYLQLDEVIHIVEEEQAQKQIVTFEVLEILQEQCVDTVIREFNVENIYYFEYVNRRIKIRTVNGDFYFADQMKNVIHKMRDYPFESCHQSYLINLNYVKKLKGYELLLKNGEMIPVSQKKSAGFREKINQFIQKSI